MIDLLSSPWPWWVAGPAIGLTLTLLLGIGNRAFGVSSSLQHLCAAFAPGRSPVLRYDWRRSGLWNLVFVLGITVGGGVAGSFLTGAAPVEVAEPTAQALDSLGVAPGPGLVPFEIYSLSALGSLEGFVVMVLGGFLVGFGARYAGGCTSGHGVTGLASGQLPSLVAVLGFFAGGLLATHALLPWLLQGLIP